MKDEIMLPHMVYLEICNKNRTSKPVLWVVVRLSYCAYFTDTCFYLS